MNFLAIDTSGAYLSVVACHGGRTEERFLPACAMRHSVLLMDEIDAALRASDMKIGDCDFFGVTVGAGSFTGIRIGIATVKGLCFALQKKAVAVTSFDCLAYSEKDGRRLALVDAGHGNYYACGYDGAAETVPPAFMSRAEVDKLIADGYVPIASERIFDGVKAVNPCIGLKNAVFRKQADRIPPEELVALYLRKSSAEESKR